MPKAWGHLHGVFYSKGPQLPGRGPVPVCNWAAQQEVSGGRAGKALLALRSEPSLTVPPEPSPPPTPCPWKNRLPGNRSLVPERLGTAALQRLVPHLPPHQPSLQVPRVCPPPPRAIRCRVRFRLFYWKGNAWSPTALPPPSTSFCTKQSSDFVTWNSACGLIMTHEEEDLPHRSECMWRKLPLNNILGLTLLPQPSGTAQIGALYRRNWERVAQPILDTSGVCYIICGAQFKMSRWGLLFKERKMCRSSY